MMPGVAPEKCRFSSIYTMHFSSLRIGHNKCSRQHIVQLVCCKNCAVIVRMPKLAAAWHGENQLMNLAAGNINPVDDFAGYFVAPDVPCYFFVGNVRWPVKCGPW